ncbi:hypothetical protein NC653_010369 [Populus alba x Populus x berolinensis]|uniref:S-locus receptor kinase C-terminal domain-containing protein n=1 Tax=Populus alba x Populus x berolinensis TaxID=444605 RepID=A0AAD6W564_9ROSI|nr:hypothetical protein NC653_010369 [Populus alba x Populus x berolinensis]
MATSNQTFQQFEPGYTVPRPLFRYGGIPMNFRGNWEIPTRELHAPPFIPMFTTDREYLDSDFEEEYPLPSPRSIGAPFKSRFSAPFYCPSVGSPSVMADLVAGSVSSSPPLQVAGGEEEQPKRGRRCCWKKEVGLRRRWKSWPRERGQSDALRFVLAKPREKISGRLVVCEKEKNGEEGSCSRLRWRGRWRRVLEGRLIKDLNEPIEIKISEWNTGGLLARIEGLRAFLPKAELMNRVNNFKELKENARALPALSSEPSTPASIGSQEVWDLWREGRALEVVDTLMGDSYPEDQVLRCIQIGLLCVQESAMDRPSMSDVVFMLSNDTSLPSPKQPAFVTKESYYSGDPLTSEGSHSINEVTITMLGPR